MKYLFTIFVGIHAAIHLLGFIKAFHLAPVPQIPHLISKKEGFVWLTASVLFFLSIILFLLERSEWWKYAAAAVAVSQSIVLRNWISAKFGSIPNLIVLLSVSAAAGGCSSGYYETYRTEAEWRLTQTMPPPIITEETIATLPVPVQRYLRFTGAVGKPDISHLHVNFSGSMKRQPEGDWLDIAAEQYEFFTPNVRLFYIRSSLYGIPFDGLHQYINERATMEISVAGWFKVADARGDSMTHSETVTLLNDICLLAPSRLTDPAILWKPIDSLSVEAIFTNAGQTIRARLFFDTTGALVNFRSSDRYLSEDGSTYRSYDWSTPVKEYGTFSGRTLPLLAEAVWHLPEGDFPYARFRTVSLEYDCRTFH